MAITTESSVWLLLLCFLAGAVYAGILYFRIPRGDYPGWLLILLAVLRFLSVSAIAFLLTSPLIRIVEESVQKPVILIGVDNSASVRMGKDSLFNKDSLPGRIADLCERLKVKYQPELFSFGERISKGFNGTYDEKETDISAFLNEISGRYYNRNVGALILATDGIFNSGTDPYYASRHLTFPVYTIALGDTNLRKDIFIRQIRCNKRVYMGSPFPVQVFFEMDKTLGVPASLVIKQGEKTLAKKEIRATSDQFSGKTDFMLEPSGTGVQKFSVTISPVDGEASILNNRQEFFVEVLESKEKIAILYDLFHPDVNAMHQALEQSERYEVDQFALRNSSLFAPEKYDLIILNQVPSISSGFDLGPLMKSGKSILFILGSQSDINAFNQLNAGLIISAARLSFTEARPALNPDFTLFTLPADFCETINDWPPLLAPFGLYQYGPMTDKLFTQKIASAVTNIPLFLLNPGPQRKIGIIAGENLWRWRLFDYFTHSNFGLFDEVITKTVQYLMVKDDRSFFRVNVNPTIRENENIRMEAQVYNASYERITDPEVTITIENEERKAFPFTFSKSEDGYYLNAGFFPPGTYTYVATANSGKLRYTRKGSFIVTPVNIESLRLIADHGLLLRIAAAHDGKMIRPEEMDNLLKLIREREDIHSVSYTSRHFSDLVGNMWFFLTILVLLAVEWLIRKRNGI